MDHLQTHLNMWFPRGLEMFGSELGGLAVKGKFKTLANGPAQQMYLEESRGKVRDINLSAVAAKVGCSRDAAEVYLERILAGETVEGLTKDDLLFLPDRRVFPIRGPPADGDLPLDTRPRANRTWPPGGRSPRPSTWGAATGSS